MTLTLKDIQQAATRITPYIYQTPCTYSPKLSKILNAQVYLKNECKQQTGSFKERGALNTLLQLSPKQKQQGVIAASAGNHALGIAHHAQRLNIPATVVMPTFAPLMKIVNCQNLGAKVIRHGQNIHDAKKHAMTLVQENNLTYINGFDDLTIIAGQGTIALEILDQHPDTQAIIVPIGGAGLIAGIALAAKSINPQIKIYGVEPKRCASFSAACQNNAPILIDSTPTIADGLAVPRVGDNAYHIAKDRIDALVSVGERAIAIAVLRLIELEKSVVEGAGAAGLAACLQGKLPQIKNKKIVIPLCGGNIDTTVLDQIIERGLVADGRLCRFQATISDRPGGLAVFTKLLADQGASVKDIAHDRAFAGEDLNAVLVHCVVETRDAQHIKRIRDALTDAKFPVIFHDLAI